MDSLLNWWAYYADREYEAREAGDFRQASIYAKDAQEALGWLALREMGDADGSTKDENAYHYEHSSPPGRAMDGQPIEYYPYDPSLQLP